MLHNGVPDRNRHLYYNTEKKLWYCFACGYSGSGENPGDEPSVLHRVFPGVQLSSGAIELHELLMNGDTEESLIVRAARKYLKEHHVDPERIAFERRLLIDGQYLVFPVYRRDQIIYWQKRHLFSKEFLNPPVETKPLFWTEPDSIGGRVVLVESFLNACRIDLWARAVCIFGKFLHDEAAEEIRQKADSVYVCLDAGEQAAAMDLCRKLHGVGVKKVRRIAIHAPVGTDLCDLKDWQVRRLLK